MTETATQFSDVPGRACVNCGTTNQLDALRCWFCLAEQGERAARLPPLSVPNYVQSRDRSQSLIAVVVIASVVLTVLVGLGLSIDEPGSLVPYLVVVGLGLMSICTVALVSLTGNKTLTAVSTVIASFFFGICAALAVVWMIIAAFFAFLNDCMHGLH